MVHEVQASLGYPVGRRLYTLLRATWYWPHMVTDCVRLCKEALPC